MQIIHFPSFKISSFSYRVLKISLILLLFIPGLLFALNYYSAKSNSLLNSTLLASASSNTDSSTPTFIRIPDLEISQVIHQSEVAGDDTSFMFQDETPYTIEKNIIILLGKNNQNIFKKFSTLKKGSHLILITKDGTVHNYYIWKIFKSSLSSFTPTRENSLYLALKDSFFSQKQLIFEAVEIIN